MKTIITSLLTLSCFCAMAETDTNSAKIDSYLNTLTEQAFKAGVLTGHGYTVLGLATNIDGLSTSEAGHRISEQAWGDFQRFQQKRHAEAAIILTNKQSYVTNGFPVLCITNGYNYTSSNYPNTVRLELSGMLETNWTTTSIETPVVAKGHEYDAVMRYDMQHQTGVVMSNTVATFQWNGKTLTNVLESVEVFHTNRTIGAISSTINIQ